MNKDYVDSLSKQELYEEFQRIVNTHWSTDSNNATVRILTETEAAILTRILELHLLNLEDASLAEMAKQIKDFGPYQKS
jgi:hypothetical protein